MIDLSWRNFLSPEFVTKFHIEKPLFWRNLADDRRKEASMSKTSSFRPVVATVMVVSRPHRHVLLPCESL